MKKGFITPIFLIATAILLAIVAVSTPEIRYRFQTSLNLGDINTFPTTLNSWSDDDVIESDWANQLEAKLGIDNSTITTSLDYLIKSPTSTLGSIYNITPTDGVFIVADGSKFVGESGATARTSIGLGSVENTALSTWAGTSNITTLGTLTTAGGNISLWTNDSSYATTGYTGWEIATSTDLIAGTGLTLTGSTLSNDLGTAIEKGEISNSGTLSFDWADSEVANDITASNYLPLAGGTITGDLTVNGTSTLATTTITDLTVSDVFHLNGVVQNDIDMNGGLITNIGNAGTDFTSGGGLNLASGLSVSGNATATSFTIGSNTLTTSEFGYLDGIDQALKTTDSPTFAGLTSNGNIAFDTTDRTIAGIANGNLLDKSATESISGVWNFTNNLGLNTATFGTSASNVLGIANGTAPTTSPADEIQMWSADVEAEKAVMNVRNEDGTTFSTWKSGARAYRGTSNQTIANNTWTTLQFNAETFDTQSEFDSTTNYQFTAKKAGRYLITTQVYWDGNATGNRQFMFQRSGSNVTGEINYPPSADAFTQNMSDEIDMTAGQTLLLVAYQSSGSDLDIRYDPLRTYLAITKIQD